MFSNLSSYGFLSILPNIKKKNHNNITQNSLDNEASVTLLSTADKYIKRTEKHRNILMSTYFNNYKQNINKRHQIISK